MTLTDRIRPLILLQGITGLTGGGSTHLDGIPTAGLPVPMTGYCTLTGEVSFYLLRAGTDAESSPDIIRPDDYAAGTNEKVWELLELNTAAVIIGALMASANLSDLGSVATARTNLGLGTAATKDAGAASGVATLDGSGKVPSAQLPGAVAGGMTYRGTWNASTNTPNLDTIGPATGDYYVISVAGAHTLMGESDTDWQAKDWAVYNGTGWNKIDNTEQDATGSVNGNVRLTSDLGGMASSPQVVGLQTKTLPAASANGFLKWNAAANAWELVIYGSAANTVCQGNDARLSDSRAPNGSAGGDFSSTYPNPTLKGTAAGLSPAVATLTDAAPVVWDVTNNRVSNATVTLGANRILSITGAVNGCTGNLIVKQDVTGSRTLTLPSGSKVIGGGAGAVTLTTAAGSCDILSLLYDGTNYWWTIGKNYT